MRFLVALLISSSFAAATVREIPKALPDHPGNIFTAGEDVIVPVPAPDGPWRIADYDKKISDVAAKDGKIDLGKLRVGYYELRRKDADPDKITVGVIAPLLAATPEKSPISIDVAMAWSYRVPATQKSVVNLCQIAGINWVRDRLSWPEMEPTRGKFVEHNGYDDSAKVQSDAGLKVLQVNHISPPWANANSMHFPPDLRDVYRFNKEMAARWKGQVLALEPWNEADIKEFGGHTGSEMATLQKAAYWGQKAGNPDINTCENVFAIARQTTLDDFGANDASPYFDTYDLHHYVYLEKYPAYYAAHRAVSGGKPMWVTECNITVVWEGDPKKQEPSDTELHYGAHRVAKIFAASIYQGSVNTFFFMLPHYVERNIQYGLLHQDLTPRPAYMALAAAGRLMAGASPVGKVRNDDPKYHAYLFRALPDGKERFVLVGWYDAPAERSLKVGVPIEAMYDNLGRAVDVPRDGKLELNGSPQFAVMKADPSSHLNLEPPPKPPARNDEKPSPVVLQFLPTTKTILDQSASAIDANEPLAVPLVIYNFGDKAAHGNLRVTAPNGWDVKLESTEATVEPGARQPLPDLMIDPHGAANGTVGTVRIDGDFGDTGKIVLSARFIVQPKEEQKGY